MTVALAALLLAAPPDSSLGLRNLHQQMLAVEVWQALDAAGETPEDPVQFVQLLADRWDEQMAEQPAAYRRWGTYPSMWAVLEMYGQDTTTASQCRVWERFAVPAFAGDADDLAASSPSLDRAALFFRPNLDWAYNASLRGCVLSADAWERLVRALRLYVEAADAYLASDLADGDPDSGPDEAYVAGLRATATRYLDEAQVEQALRDGDLADALVGLVTWVGVGRTPYGADALGRRLALAYVGRGETGQALAIYDLLGRALSDEILPTERLAAWYVEGGAEPDRIDRVRPATSTLLVPSSETADLSGTFDRVGAAGSLDLASVRGGLVLLDFWSIGCGPCIEEIPTLNRLDETYGDRLTIVSVNNDVVYDTPLDAVRETIGQYGLETTVVTDTEDGVLTERFDVVGWPLYLLVDPSSRVLVESREGRRNLSLSEVEAYVRALPVRP
ncbi:TlpA disulfide reductase family protein [Rubrivirga sp. S365]|uniref:TlpA disulfide reductase family protein n=1 Tax=Rubrivirga litoralis TaxID=3075598 RepID=A0ABU3BS59_9BACT|nr:MULTISPECIES: TlpA disulfide reductase family protein [unclassified Rubrivirga]MDT0632130.1 TlpA disulfide reductase family protein [Rubrivirga sp. F394]MDT7857021.1 TlpA disulfide reductase family protein [Rubrivirga sp. S365]